MNKKFLSAILFGAMLATSAGTFVSCKDYDDDIKGLQTQIDTNKNAIAELQKLVGAGNWVTSVAASGENLVVTMSNGTTATIAGIKGADGKDGVDGKNAAEWTISEDGFWCKDGEKTANVAVAKDGKNGLTAPSPAISANGMWVVYSWDAAKGEFVAEETEIPAAGTSAYAVKANGIYTLYIADADGEMQEIALPATSDAFVATSPATLVEVLHQEAKWTKVTGEDKKLFAKLAAAFPEIEEYKKDDLMKQGGNLPVIISPANVDLSEGYKFSLQNVKGEVSEAIISAPVKGMPACEWEGTKLETRGADANECLWTLNVEPAKNKKGTAYLDINEPNTLVVENAKGTIVKTAFAYTVTSQEVGRVDVKAFTGNTTIAYNDGIDVLAKAYDLDQTEGKDAIFTIDYGMNGKYILEVNKLHAEKYGVVVDGSKLTINNMPTDKNSVDIQVTLSALGLNGTVDYATKLLHIGQVIAATGTLEDVTVTLNANASKNQVRWNIEDLGFTALQLNEFMNASSKTLEVSYINDDDEKVIVENPTISVYQKDGKTTATNYEDASIFGINLNAANYKPGNYDLRLVVSNGTVNNPTIIYVAEGTLTVENPTTAAIKLAAAFVDENGVLQVTGNPLNSNYTGYVVYDLTQAFVYKTSEVAISKIEDLDADDESNWITGSTTLKVNKYDYEDADKQDLYKVRNFKVTYSLFGNTENKEEMEFQAQVVSEIYAEDPSTVITLTAARLTTAFGAKNLESTDKIDESIIDFTQITTAVYAAGLDAGKEYKLWGTDGNKESSKEVTVTAYDKINVSKEGYVLDASGLPIEIAKADLAKFGMSAEAYMLVADDAKFYLTANSKEWTVKEAVYGTNNRGQRYEVSPAVKATLMGWNQIVGKLIPDYYNYNEYASFVYVNKTVKVENVSDAIKTAKGLFDTYKTSIKFGTQIWYQKIDAVNPTYAANGKVTNVVFGFVNGKEDAEKYVQSTINEDGTLAGTSLKAQATTPLDVVGGQVIVPMYIEITDAWGMVMKHEFNVTIKTVQE